jgi:hypothetical protein
MATSLFEHLLQIILPLFNTCNNMDWIEAAQDSVHQQAIMLFF